MSALAVDLAAALDPVRLAVRCGLTPEGWQEQLLRSIARRILVLAARQVGKTYMTGLVALHAAAYALALVLVVSHRLEGSVEFVGHVRTWARALGLVDRESETELRLVNGSRVVALPATTGSTRGYSAASLIVLDEVAHVERDEEVVAAVLPALRADGRIVALTTAGGARGWFYRQWIDGGAEWQRILVRAKDSAQYTPERIAARRLEIGSWAARRDLDCEFAGSGDAYFDFDAVRACLRSDLKWVA